MKVAELGESPRRGFAMGGAQYAIELGAGANTHFLNPDAMQLQVQPGFKMEPFKPNDALADLAKEAKEAAKDWCKVMGVPINEIMGTSVQPATPDQLPPTSVPAWQAWLKKLAEENAKRKRKKK